MWGGGRPVEGLRRKDIHEFLDWVHERAARDEGTNPGRTADMTLPQPTAFLALRKSQ